MATGLGALVVRLGLEAAEFVAGLTKSEFEAQRATRRIKAEFDGISSSVKSLAAQLGVAFSVGAIVKFTGDLIGAAANLDDMAEKTGASVEQLSTLAQQAHISGTSLETVEMGLIKLSKALNENDEEAKKATKALDALGLKAADLRGLDTAQAMKIIAVELDKFRDSGGKTALLLDLLGKSAAQLAPYLKDLARDAALSANVTTEQAAAAEELSKSWQRLTLDARNVGQAMAMEIVPVLKDLIEQFKIGKEVSGGFWSALRLGMQNNEDPVGKLEAIRKKLESLSKLQEELSKDTLANRVNRNLPLILGGNDLVDIKRQMAHLEEQKKFYTSLAAARGEKDNFERFGVAQETIKYQSPPKEDKSSAISVDKAAAAAERYQQMLIGLESQLRSVTGAETELQKIRDKMAADNVFASIPARERERLRTAIETVAAQIDQAKAQKEVTKSLLEHIDAVQSEEEAQLRAAGAGESFTQKMERLRDTVRAIVDPTYEAGKAFKDLALAVTTGWISEADANFAKLDERIRGLLRPTENLFESIQKAWEANQLTDAQMEQAFKAASDQMSRGTDEANKFADAAHAIGTAFEDAILGGKKLGDVVEALGEDIGRIALRMAVTKPLEGALQNVLSTGFGSLLGGGTQTPAPVFTATPSWVAPSYATGTDYVPRTGLYMLHQGESVTPASENNGRGMKVEINVDARGATQDAIPGIVGAVSSLAREIEKIKDNDGYRRADASRRLR